MSDIRDASAAPGGASVRWASMSLAKRAAACPVRTADLWSRTVRLNGSTVAPFRTIVVSSGAHLSRT